MGAQGLPRLRYECDAGQLPERLRAFLLRLQPDAATAKYLTLAEKRRLSPGGMMLRRVLGYYLSDYDVDGLLNTYPMHLASTEQWRQMLPVEPGGRLLDVGAGSGDVTAGLAELFGETDVTETARVLGWRLRRRGFTVHHVDVSTTQAPGGPYDVVTVLNVLDRCIRPRALLAGAVHALRPGGYLAIALPLPYRPVAYDGPYLVEPIDPLDCHGETWEESLVSLVVQTLEPAGLSIQSLARVPYLAGADARQELNIYDDAVIVCRVPHKRSEVSPLR